MTSKLSRCLGWHLGLALFFCSHSLASATTVRPPSFDELVQRADRVYHARVVDRSSRVDSHQGRQIVRTEVVVEIIEPIAGEDAGARRHLRFLGGRADGLEMIVDGMPDLGMGDEVVLFERGNGSRVCPIVSWRYGHLRISRAADGGTARVRRADFTPLRSVGDVGKPLFQRDAQIQAFKSGPEAMTLEQLMAEVRMHRGGES